MLQLFLEEANEHLGTLEPSLLKLEETMEAPDKDLVNTIFRAVHSLKGSAGFFGFDNITNLSHSMESMLSLIRDGKLKPTSKMITALLSGTDKLSRMIGDIDHSNEIDYAEEEAEINRLMSGDSPQPEMVELNVSGRENLPEKLSREFNVPESSLKEAVAHGHFLYAVRAFTKKDIKNQGKTPLDYLREIQKLGNLIGSYADISVIGGLDDVRNSDIPFVFLFSSVLEPDLISAGLEVEESQVEELNIPEFTSQARDTAKKMLQEDEVTVVAEEEEAPLPVEASPEEVIAEPKEIPETPEPVQPVKGPEVPAKAVPSKPKSESRTAPKETLRVNVELLNDLMTLAGELVLARNQLMRMASGVSKSVPGLQNVLQDINMTTTILQGKIMDTRMQPISLVFNKFPRLIRDLQRKLGKKIALNLFGNDVDLDKSIIENLSDPLTHLVRNSADHGIELPDERKKKGKPEMGTIVLKAYHEGGKVNIDVIDDGGGIDPKKIAKKALERNLITKQELDRMSGKDIYDLLFAPGFSTAKEVSDVSGRGVGMDVVRTNIEKLGGSVTVDSVPGQGTTMNLKLPLTLAIIPSLIVTVRKMHFAIPQVALREIVRIKQDDSGARDHRRNLGIERVNDAPVLRLRKKLLPIVYLEEVLGLEPDSGKDTRIVRVLVLQHDEHEFGLVVDGIFDSEEIVVKSIPRFFKQSKAYAGTTIMGDGSVALILDVGGIAQKSKLNFSGLKEQTRFAEQTAELKHSAETQSLLIFENAQNERFALNLDLIKRIEKIEKSQIDNIGQKMYIEHEGKSMRIIELEQFLPVRSPEEIDPEFLYVIIPHQVETPVGIIARQIIDSIDVDIRIDTENISARGLLGSALIEDQVVLFPDIYELIELAEPERFQMEEGNDNNQYKLLLIEDTPFFRTIEKQYLESVGYNVDTAIDGIEALKKCNAGNYDLLVVDIIMPRMDGFEFVRHIRKDDRLKHLPVVALTTLANQESRNRARELGFDAYEVKLHKDKLLRTITKLLSEKSA